MHGDFSDEEMNQLYNHPKVKAHINITHGEGFGRPLLEASLTEKPVIASNWSGHVDFLSSNAVLLGGALGKVPKKAFPKDMRVDGAQWFTVNYNNTSGIMMDVFKSYKKYTLNAKKLSMMNKKMFSLDAMTRRFGQILDEYLPEFPKEVKLELPKLKKVGSVEPPKAKLPKLKKV